MQNNFETILRKTPMFAGLSGAEMPKLDPWIWVVISASIGFMLSLALNFAASVYLAFAGRGPAFPHVFDQHYLALMAWGFLVPFVWGFSAKWMSVFLGLKPIRPRLLLAAVAVNAGGVLLAFLGAGRTATAVFFLGAVLAPLALRMFEPAQHEPKIRGVHSSFPFFVRTAYAWLLVAALLGVAAALWDTSGGIWGASRHALTVGFVSVMVFSVGQRILPAFAGMRLLWSARLMFACLALLNLGCMLRVFSEVVAYQAYADWAWTVLPFSAVTELSAVTIFAINIFGTFLLEPSHARRESVVVGIGR